MHTTRERETKAKLSNGVNMGLNTKEYILDEAAVEAVSVDLQAYLQGLGVDRKSILRLRLSVEEMLLNIMEGCGGGLHISVGIGRQFGQHVIRLQYAGDVFDPTRGGEDDWARNLLKGTGYFPCWNYRGRTKAMISRSIKSLLTKTAI